MSSLTAAEATKLEKLLDMPTGYVFGFSDRTFGNFFASEELGVNIHSEKYSSRGSSKANKLREFWRLESDYLVGQAIKMLVAHIEEHPEALVETPNKKALLEPCKEISKRLMAGKVHLGTLKETAVAFNAHYLSDQIRRMELSIESDPALAIGTAKELVETCCKTILAERGKPVSGSPEMPVLTKDTLKELKLIPDDVPDDAKGRDTIKRVLQNLSSMIQGITELRSLYGTGHGKHGKAQGLTPRHARLAVGAASTLVTFLFDTHKHTLPPS